MSGAAVLFADAEAVCANYLRASLHERGDVDTVVCTGAVPDPRPDRFVHLRRLGGVRATPVTDAAQISAECWGADQADAQDIAQLSRALLLDMAATTQDGVPVGRVSELAGVGYLPDMFSQTPRFVFSVVVHLRGAPLH